MSINEVVEKLCESEPLLGPLVYELKIVSGNTQTMATDGKHLYYSQEFLDGLNMREACGVVLHEVLHCSFVHLWRREKRNPWKWNVACDYAINIIVTESFPLPKGVLLDMKYFGMSAEEIYDALPKLKKKKSKGSSSGEGKGDGSDGEKGKSSGKKQKKSGSSSGESSDDKYEEKQQGWGEHDKWEGQKKKGKGKKKESLSDKIKRILGGKEDEREEESSSEQEKWERKFNEKIAKQYGKMPDSIKRIIEKNFYIPVIDWTSLVQNLLSEDITDYTFSQPDRRFLEADYMLPDLYSYDRLKDIVFAYDTSGSITEDDLRAFYIETLNLFSNFSSLQGWIAVCDAYLHHFGPVDYQQSFEDFHFYGGGGTDFRPVFDKIKEDGIRPKALFYFTDTQGSFPDEDPGYPVFWLVRTQVGGYYGTNVPFGTVIHFLPKN